VLALLGVAFFARYKRWKDFRFRVQALAVLSGYMILFSDCPETHTYIIAFPFYAMAFWLQERRTWIDWALFWSLVVNFCILPTDVLCPVWLHEWVHTTLWLDVYTFFLCWLRIIWWAVGPLPAVGKKAMVVAALLLMLPLGSMSAQGVARVYKVNGVEFRMLLVQGGTFTMGALPGDTLADDDEARHQATVADYFIGETEVTQELWEAVMPKNRSKHKGARLPVEYVTYDMCQEFIGRLSRLTGRPFRLPTEAEWEYAARGGKRSKGYLYAGGNEIGQVGLTLDSSAGSEQPVAQQKPNELGLYDMSGNVWEWCSDWYAKEPSGRPSRYFHVIRGGAYDCSPRYCRTSNRFMYDERRRRPSVGFRLAMTR
jgi:formylglycine-generating enzyme required for sulfatase activity